MEGQAQPPQGRPQVVPVAEVGELVGQAVAQHGPVRRRLRRHIDRRPDQTEQAGGGDRPGDVHRQGEALHRQRLAATAQGPAEAEVDPHQPQPQERRPRGPDDPQDHSERDRGSRLRPGGVQLPLPLGQVLLILCLLIGGREAGIGLRRGQIRGLAPHVVHRRGGDLVLHPLHGVQDAHRRAAEAHRDQQPQEHQGPQAVLEPQADLPLQALPQEQHRQNQHAGGHRPLKHGAPPPIPSAAHRAGPAPPGTGPASGSWR